MRFTFSITAIKNLQNEILIRSLFFGISNFDGFSENVPEFKTERANVPLSSTSKGFQALVNSKQEPFCTA